MTQFLRNWFGTRRDLGNEEALRGRRGHTSTSSAGFKATGLPRCWCVWSWDWEIIIPTKFHRVRDIRTAVVYNGNRFCVVWPPPEGVALPDSITVTDPVTNLEVVVRVNYRGQKTKIWKNEIFHDEQNVWCFWQINQHSSADGIYTWFYKDEGRMHGNIHASMVRGNEQSLGWLISFLTKEYMMKANGDGLGPKIMSRSMKFC